MKYQMNFTTSLDDVTRFISAEDLRRFYKEHGCDWSVRFGKDGLIVTNSKDGVELFRKGMFVIYDWEEKLGRELNDNALLIQSGEMKLLPCQLEPTQVISIKVTPEKEILLLPKFAI